MKYLSLFFLCLLLISCSVEDKNDLTILDIEAYEDTSAWNLAKAVKAQNVSKIKTIGKENPELLNFKDPHFGSTLLVWAIKMEKYKSTKALLEAGANPNIITDLGVTALFSAVSYSWKDTQAKTDAKYVELLLNYGADPNTSYVAEQYGPGKKDPIEDGTSPLMHATSLEKTKALVEAGAEINYKTKTGKTAAVRALLRHRVDQAHYLIAKKNAEVSDPYYFYELGSSTEIDSSKKHYPVDLLNDWIFDLGSEEHKKKMKIVEEFERQGVDYWSREVSEATKQRIKKLYPENWQEYLEKY